MATNPIETSSSPEPGTGRGPLLGARLRASRMSAGISLRELARRVGVSPSFMSQVERDKAAPSVGTLYTIVSELGLTLDSVMRDPNTAAEEAPLQSGGVSPRESHSGESTSMIPSAPSMKLLPDTGHLPGLQRKEGRAEILLGGVRWERLTPVDDPEVEFLRVCYTSGSESCPADNLMHHGGQEYFHILSGQLEVQVGFARQTLRPGDSVNFDSSVPHRLSNPYTEDCTAIWFVVGRSTRGGDYLR